MFGWGGGGVLKIVAGVKIEIKVQGKRNLYLNRISIDITKSNLFYLNCVLFFDVKKKK